MPAVQLIHPISVTLEQLDRSVVAFDATDREAIHGPRTSATKTITVQAQVKFYDLDDPRAQVGGVQKRSKGYILVHRGDLAIQGVVLARGDKITSMGEGLLVKSGLNLYLLGSVPQAHYTDQGGASLERWNFEDREPVR